MIVPERRRNPVEASGENEVPMEHHEQVDAFTEDLWRLTTWYRHEFDLTLEAYIGVLQCLIHELAQPQIWEMGLEDEEDE